MILSWIPNPISKLTPDMLYRQVEFLVEEEDRAQHGLLVEDLP